VCLSRLTLKTCLLGALGRYCEALRLAVLPARRGDSALEAAAGAFADYLRRRHPELASRVVAFDDEAALEDYVTAAEVRQPSTFPERWCPPELRKNGRATERESATDC
jgi:hypothetical protein